MKARFGIQLLFLCAVLALGVAAFGGSHFLIASEAEWQGAMEAGKISPIASAQWGDYMLQWAAHLEEGSPYPVNEFVPASLPDGQLYVSPGGGGSGYPSDAGLVMVWKPRTSGSYSSAWKYDYGLDPNLNNCTINVTVTPPQFGLSGQINVVSFGIQDINGNIRAWYWNCGPGGLPWGVPTTITINTAVLGLAAANPIATGYMSNPLFNLANSQSFIVDENVQWVGGPMPVPPPPGTLPGVWNYWHNLVVTPNIQPKYPDPVKWSQPVVEVQPGLQPPLFNGWDERSQYYQQPICADDWLCADQRPVTDIHWWGSFINWTQPTPPQLPQAFHIGIWTDVPANPPGIPFSHPGTLVWQNWCTSYVWNFAGYDRDPRGTTTNEACFQFNQWLQPSEYFYQDPGPTGQRVYWLSIAAVYTGTPQYPWGWKTRPHFFNDDAVRITQVTPAWPPAIGSTWAAGSHITYPTDTSWDLAFELTTNEVQQWDYDWGDAPDPTYPTLSANLGANHMIVTTMYLGTQIDAETDGQPNANATGDDIAGVDDEDGVQWTTILTPGAVAGVDVTASVTGFLDAWVDFNRDGDWADLGEQVFASQPLVAGLNPLTFLVPAGASQGSTFARFRYSSTGGLSYTGPAGDGEVEDYEVAIACYKWIQYPDVTTLGIDVDASSPYILADDFQCTETGPITDIHIWGSWRNDQLPNNDPNQVQFTLSLHRDIPAGANGYSRPGQVLWSRTFQPGEFQAQAYRRGIEEGWMNAPDPSSYFFPGDTVCWQYNFYLNPNEFCQTGTETAPVVYWLDVQARPLSADARFGWKTSESHWNDDAVWGQGVEPYMEPWFELRYPPNHELYPESIDLAFAITGCCPEKYTQPPDTTTRGFDVNATYPYLLADDFPCTKTGPVSGVTVWASWKDDLLPVGGPGQASFTVSLYNDKPIGPNGYSQPDNVLWSRTYNPGQFQWKTYASGLQEGWLTPPTNYVFPGDTVAYQYDFPLQPGEFTQEGSPTQQRVYWVGIQANVQGAASSCILPDRNGTADLPPVGCAYPTPDGDMKIEDGLPAGATIQIDATHTNFVCSDPNACSLPPAANCRQPGGSLGGEKECFDSQLLMPMVGTGSLAGFNRMISLPVSFEVHTAPRTPGDPVQSFNTDMFRLQGQLPIGDPDFDLLRITAGTAFGMPSPGHTTLTQLPSGNWAVDSFFDITYRIDFVGAPGSVLYGHSGSTTGTVRFQIPSDSTSVPQFGWKTSYTHWNDDAVWGQGPAPYPTITPWGELRYPPQHPQYPDSCDLAFQIQTDCPCQQLDWGDAPDPSYPTLAANLGANHAIVPTMYLGALVDAEPDGQPTPIADGDDINGVPDDEDGVVFSTPLAPGAPATVTVTASIAGMLDAWIDFNGDGDWDEANERIFTLQPLAAGSNTLTFAVPIGAGISGAYMSTFARFRYSSAGVATYTGFAPDGEVEDYHVTIYPRPVIVTKARAKCVALGSYVLIKRDVVTANFGQFGWYFEEPLRFAALGVLGTPGVPASTWSPGQLVSCYGYTVMNGCELMLQEVYSWLEGTGSVRPLGQNNRNSGGGAFCNQPGLTNIADPTVVPAVGLNSVAMLVTLWGRCTCVEQDGAVQANFWIDDGSNLWDGSYCASQDRALGVKVRMPSSGGPGIQGGGYYAVTGIMRTYTNAMGQCVRWLWPRSSADIVPVAEP